MAKLVAALTTSHVPAIAAAMDTGLTHDPYWKPLFDGYDPAKRFVEEVKPDITIVVYNDHASAFSIDIVPTFSWHMIEHLVAQEFDITMFQEWEVDHGFNTPMSIAFGDREGKAPFWPTKVVPIVVNTIQYPLPLPTRCFKLGQAIRRAIDAYPGDERVMIMGTGGMSHQLQGERAGFLQPSWDRAFLDKFVSDPQSLVDMPLGTYMKEAGHEGAELIMWLVARGAMNPQIREVYRHYHFASLTGAGLGCYLND